MLALLPLASLVLLVVIAWKLELAWRPAVLLGSAAWGVVVVALTELLSALDAVTSAHVLEVWVAMIWGLFAALYLVSRRRGGFKFDRVSENSAARLRVADLVLLACLGLGLGLVAVVAVVAAPNNSDGMGYHLARVIHWMQNGNVRFYPTHVLRQLHANPFAEFLLLHLQLLSGSDRAANLVQWSALAGCLVGVSLLAQRLGAGVRGQVMAAVFAGTLSMAVLEGSNVQNDLVVAFWVVCFAAFGLVLIDWAGTSHSGGGAWPLGGGLPWAITFGAGASLGLAILTKATAYIYAFPFCVWLGVALLRRVRVLRWRLGAVVGVMLLLAALLNAGHWTRNQRLYGSPLGPAAEEPQTGKFKYSNDAFTPGVLASNVMRNVALELQSPWAGWNKDIGRVVETLHRWLHIALDDPRSTWSGTTFATAIQWGTLWINEDTAGDPLHVILLTGAAVAVVASRRFGVAARVYAAAVFGGWLLFCGYLKWQPWHCRLQLPLMILWAPVVGLALGAAGRRIAAGAVLVLGLVMVGVAVTCTLKSAYHPVLGPYSVFKVDRADQYFYSDPGFMVGYKQVAEIAEREKCARVGYVTSQGPEYALWIQLRRNVGSDLRLEHVHVTNVSATTAAAQGVADFRPCLTITLTPAANGTLSIELSGE